MSDGCVAWHPGKETAVTSLDRRLVLCSAMAIAIYRSIASAQTNSVQASKQLTASDIGTATILALDGAKGVVFTDLIAHELLQHGVKTSSLAEPISASSKAVWTRSCSDPSRRSTSTPAARSREEFPSRRLGWLRSVLDGSFPQCPSIAILKFC